MTGVQPSPGKWFQLHFRSLYILTVILLLLLKAYRITLIPDNVTLTGILDLFLSDLILYTSLYLLLPGFWKFRSKLRGAIPVLFTQIVLSTLFVVELVAHNYYIVIGRALEFPIIQYFFQQYPGTLPVAKSEVSTGLVILLLTGLILLAVVPWLTLGRGSAGFRWFRPVVGILLLPLVFLFPLGPSVSKGTGINSVAGILLSALSSPIEEDLVNAVRFDYSDRLELSKAKDAPLFNIVIIVLESTRASACSPYKPSLATTPFMRDLAASSLVAERAYPVIPHTSKALISILCGIEPNISLEISEAIPGGIPGRSLPDLVGDLGYRTAFFQSVTEAFESRRQVVRNLGFQEFYPLESMSAEGFERTNYFGFEENIMLEPARKWIQREPETPFLLTFLTGSGHHQYIVPERYGKIPFVEGRTDFNNYLNNVRYVDFFIRNLFDLIASMGLSENTLFVIVGDHGEAFGEHGMIGHDAVLYDEGLRIPLIIHAPGRFPDGRRISQPVSQMDITPTILDLCGFTLQGGALRGESMLNLTPERSVLVHTIFENHGAALIRGTFKYIHGYGKRSDHYFDLAEDPEERNDRIDSVREREAGFIEELVAWRSSVRATYRDHIRSILDANVFPQDPGITYPAEIHFGGRVVMIGYDAEIYRYQNVNYLEIATCYRVDERLPGGYDLCLDLVHPERGVRHLDHDIVFGLYPVKRWRSGDFVVDRHTYEIPRTWGETELNLYAGFFKKKALPVEGSEELNERGLARFATLNYDPDTLLIIKEMSEKGKEESSLTVVGE